MKAADGLRRALASFPITAPSLLFLLLLSSAWLTYVTRRELPQRNSQMEQLDLLSSSFVMLQSFQVDSGQSAPAFWSERLGRGSGIAALEWLRRQDLVERLALFGQQCSGAATAAAQQREQECSESAAAGV